MSGFSQDLQAVSRRLDLPQPRKSRILCELKYDLEDAYEHNIAAGMHEREAAESARRAFALSDEVIRELMRIHRTPLRKLLDRLPGGVQTGMERAVLLLMSLALVLLSARAVIIADFHRNSSVFLLPVAAIGFYILARGAEKLFQIHVMRRHNVQALRQGLFMLPLMAAVNCILGIGGYFLELYHSGGAFMSPMFDMIVIRQPGDPGAAMQMRHITGYLSRSSGLMTTVLLVTLLALLLWYVIERSIQKIEYAETSVYL
ncbi:hypothetical protein JXO52_11500 [bacterium]|nr:hypothetical protein [bacterium]